MKKTRQFNKARSFCSRRFLLAAYGLFLGCALKAQDTPIQGIKSHFAQYAQRHLQEKLYVHTDKDFYVAGEILWFKIYDVSASVHLPLDISQVAYVEILDRNNRPVSQTKIRLKEGSGSGSFYLPLSIISENYQLRAYTSWMKNFNPDFYFTKNITIVNSKKSPESQMVSDESAPEVHFFPEGGNLVAGIRSKMAVKAVSHQGRGVDGMGALLDEQGDTAARFQTLRFGMGHFDFMPAAGHHYHGIWIVSNGKTVPIEMPVIYPEGFVLSLKQTGTKQLEIHVETNLLSPNSAYLFVHTGSYTRFASALNFEHGQATLRIEPGQLGEGVCVFTLFDSKGQPLCERLYFIYPTKTLKLDMHPIQTEVGIRGKIDVQVSAADENELSETADLSASVCLLDSLQTPNENSIESYLWLCSDLKGRIESPDYYFDKPDVETSDAMDNLMLTQGWRRFDWAQVLSDSQPAPDFVPELNGHIITAKVENIRTGVATRDITAYLSVPSLQPEFATAISDSNGNVRFEMRKMYGTTTVVVQTRPADSAYRVNIVSPFAEKYADRPLPPFYLARDVKNPLLDQSVDMQVQNIFLASRLRQFESVVADSALFYLKAPISYFLDNYTRFTTMEEVLREYVDQISVKSKKGQYHLEVVDTRKKGYFDDDPLILLDGVPVFDAGKIMAYDPLRVRKLDVLNDRYYMDSSAFEGILSFMTYDGNLPGFELDPHVTVIDYEGIQAKRVFYSPLYDTPDKKESNFPDFRNVLYWSPDIKTDKSGRQLLTFYASDIPGKYAVVLQGVARDGRCGSGVILINVKQ